jgi:hypothetical protein
MQSLTLMTNAWVACHGAEAIYAPRPGTLRSLFIPGAPRYRLIADGTQLGAPSDDRGAWFADTITNSSPALEPCIRKLIPKRDMKSFVNLAAFRRVKLVFDSVPREHDLELKQVWILPISAATHRPVYPSTFLPPQFFADNYDQIRKSTPQYE